MRKGGCPNTLIPLFLAVEIYGVADSYHAHCWQTLLGPTLIDRQVSSGQTHAVFYVIQNRLVEPLEWIPSFHERVASLGGPDGATTFIPYVDAIIFDKGVPEGIPPDFPSLTCLAYRLRIHNLLGSVPKV